MIKSIGYAVKKSKNKLEPHQFTREEPGPEDVLIEVLYTGVCHSDVHQVNNDWKNTVWPCMPGHEVVGKVTRVGANVKNFKAGDTAAVGCMIESCMSCPSCIEGNEQYCESETSWLATYNGAMMPNGQNTFGGYSNTLVVSEHFVLKVPGNLDLKSVAPILCAGVTTYSPLKHFKVKAGQKVGVVGFGGLGHMATQIARAMGAEVTVLSTSPDKKEDALRLGASSFIHSGDKTQMEEAAESLDFILNTVPEKHEIEPYLELLRRDAVMIIVGVLMPEPGWDPQKVIMKRRLLGGSLIGSIRETQEVLDFCSEHGIAPQVEVIPIERINECFENVEKKKVRYRYVIDLASLKAVEGRSDLSDLGSVGNHLKKAQAADQAA
ncbi:MAG: NAD(P)-dependent alcohol dehydrogenase [Methylotenera sp.]|nr:NAD(P)-dependent alcohol dehydrogenase [Oligoflexia bacterium]